MLTALIGIVGVLIGILLNEVLRRRNRIEGYSVRVFDKRLEIYEGLYHRVNASQEIANDVLENSKYFHDERHSVISAAILDIAGWCGDNDMYINEEISVHCIPLLMGVEDIYEMKEQEEKQAAIAHFRENLRVAKKMIRKEAGIDDIEKLFSTITKPRRASSIITYYRALKRERGAKGKFD